MDVCQVIKQRLQDLGLEQRDLATAASVTESYISQLLTRKKLPPAPGRTDIYEKMGKFLKLPGGKLSKLADEQRKDELKRDLAIPPKPLFKEIREFILGKCAPDKAKEVRTIFEKQPFGELERLVTQKFLDVAKQAVKEQLENGTRIREIARAHGKTYEQMRAIALDFLDKDAFNISAANCETFLKPLIASWEIDLSTLGIRIGLSRRLGSGNARRFEFVEREAIEIAEDDAGFKKFLKDRSLSGDADKNELNFLKTLRFSDRQPTPLYYYRELQNLRDPLHFRPFITQTLPETSNRASHANGSVAPMHKFREAREVERQLQLHARKHAVGRWTKHKTSRTANGKRKQAGKQ